MVDGASALGGRMLVRRDPRCRIVTIHRDYPIKNKPVRVWLSKMKLRGRRGASEGQRYVELVPAFIET
jgi:hypothetical protein